jgi:hypothetical protein
MQRNQQARVAHGMNLAGNNKLVGDRGRKSPGKVKEQQRANADRKSNSGGSDSQCSQAIQSPVSWEVDGENTK